MTDLAIIHSELAIIKARMRAIVTLLPAGQCPIMATDKLYERQEEMLELLWLREDDSGTGYQPERLAP